MVDTSLNSTACELDVNLAGTWEVLDNFGVHFATQTVTQRGNDLHLGRGWLEGQETGAGNDAEEVLRSQEATQTEREVPDVLTAGEQHTYTYTTHIPRPTQKSQPDRPTNPQKQTLSHTQNKTKHR